MGKPRGPCVAVFCVIGIGTGRSLLIFIHAVQIAVYCVTCMLHALGTCISNVYILYMQVNQLGLTNAERSKHSISVLLSAMQESLSLVTWTEGSTIY